MQLVLSNNRVLAHGENFISMGGTVINTETNKVYQNATVAECDGCPSDIGVVGYEYRAGRFVPCAPFGVGPGNVAVYCDECKTPRDSGMSIGDVRAVSSYLTFVGNVNADMVAAAFGKGNEDVDFGIGNALAMYGWYKGEDKTTNPFTQLRKMKTINDMNSAVYGEVIRSDNLCDLILANSYAQSKFFERRGVRAEVKADGELGGNENTGETTIVITDEDLAHMFRCSYSMNGSGSHTCEVYINDVLLDTASNTLSANNVLKSWSDYNIVSAGTYTIKAYARTAQGSATATSSLNIYKMKQSYNSQGGV